LFAFDDKNEYVLAGYWNGKLRKWPVNADILADFICNNVNTTWDTSNVKKVLKQDFDIKKFEQNPCNLNNHK
jgi:hypothetical protein